MLKRPISTEHCWECKCLKLCVLINAARCSPISWQQFTCSPLLMYSLLPPTPIRKIPFLINTCHSPHSMLALHSHRTLLIMLLKTTGKKKTKRAEVDKIVVANNALFPTWMRQGPTMDNKPEELKFQSWKKESTPKNYFM